MIRVTDYDYTLPEELIAFRPSGERDQCRLLVANRKSFALTHQKFTNVLDYLGPKDLLVINDTKVIPARLRGSIEGKLFEVFLLAPQETLRWSCLVKPGKRIKTSHAVTLKDQSTAVVTRMGDEFEVQFPDNLRTNFFEWLDSVGEPPLPPYIRREIEPSDFENYQTVYANHLGSVAAPTAGLHFSNELLEKIASKGTSIERVTLHVGYGTFAPMREDGSTSHEMHEERYRVPGTLIEQIASTRKNGGRVVAVGTTVVRALESIPALGLEGRTRLFIEPGHKFRNVDALITNFHLPRSSLLVLVRAFMGEKMQRSAYAAAIAEKYRFYSYGDAMLIHEADGQGIGQG